MKYRAALLLVFVLMPAVVRAEEAAIGKAYIDDAGVVHVVDTAGHAVSLPLPVNVPSHRYAGQTGDPDGNEDVKVSPGRMQVGWLADADACAQSYACPMSLVVYNLRLHLAREFHGSRMIATWKFLSEDEIAFCENFPHSRDEPSCTRASLATGKVVEKVVDPRHGPPWAQQLVH